MLSQRTKPAAITATQCGLGTIHLRIVIPSRGAKQLQAPAKLSGQKLCLPIFRAHIQIFADW
jgi:hypothetical protein